MNRRFQKLAQLISISLDVAGVGLALLFVDFRFGNKINPDIEYVRLSLIVFFGWISVAILSGVYSCRNITSFKTSTRTVTRAFFYFILITTIYLSLSHQMKPLLFFVRGMMVGVFVILIINRVIFSGIYAFFRSKENVNRVIVIGYNALAKKLARYLSRKSVGKHIVGFCEEFSKVHELSPFPILSRISDTLEVCRQLGVTEIYSTISPEQDTSLYKMMQQADEYCIRFKIVPDLKLFYNHRMHINHVQGLVVISARKEPLDDLGNRIQKRVFDLLFSGFITLFFLSWMIPVICLMILLESPGPVFFRQERTGKNQKSFYCLKFRTMRKNTNADLIQAGRDDTRITKVGRLLRRTSLDEFPQFLNVLKGDMSIVGPRPHMLKHTDEYSKLIEKYMVRQFLKPGITGWAQVNGFRGETKKIEQMEKRVQHDLWYLERWNLLLDVRIILRTIANITRGEKNAY